LQFSTDSLNATENRDGRIRGGEKLNGGWRMAEATSYEAAFLRCGENVCVKMPPNFADSLNHNP